MPPADPKSDHPYCGNCNYDLTGLVDSSKCPECGRPLVEILRRPDQPFIQGKRYRSKATLFGLPVIDVALGPHGREMRGKARGIIAIGDIATGGIAIGGVARGGVAIGGLAIGGCALGGGAIGLFALGGGAIGALAAGGGAVGILANGGGAAGVVAQGGGALGMYTRDAMGIRPAAASEIFDRFSWFFGGWPPVGLDSAAPMLVILAITAAVAFLIALAAAWATHRSDS